MVLCATLLTLAAKREILHMSAVSASEKRFSFHDRVCWPMRNAISHERDAPTRRGRRQFPTRFKVLHHKGVRMRRYSVALAFALMLNLLVVGAATAKSRTAVFIISDIVMPHYDRIVSGQLTIEYDDSTGAGSWSFQGMIGGQLATASGDGEFEATSADTFKITMTSIDSWKIPGIGAYVPRVATLRMVGALGYVSYEGRDVSFTALPIAITPKLAEPVEGIYTVSSPGAGESEVVTLPNTGTGPASESSSHRDSAAIAGALSALLGLSGIGAWRLRSRRRSPGRSA